MGGRSSKVRSCKVQAVEGVRTVVAPPAHKQTASAPPTPQHPEGTPRTGSPVEHFPDAPGQVGGGCALKRSATLDGWMPGVGSSSSLRELRDDAAGVVQADLPGVPCSGEVQSPHSIGYPPPGAQALPPAPGPDPPAPQPVVDTEPSTRAAKDGCSSSAASRPTLELPLEEVLKQATEAFGEMASALSSTKWDRRVQALKGITTVLKGLDLKVGAGGNHGSLTSDGNAGGVRGLQLRDHARCFNAACLILHIVLRDKVLPVLVAAHDLYRVTFEHGRASVTEAEATNAASALFPHILAKLGELNIRLHESACSCLLFTASQPFFGVPLVLARLLEVIEGHGQQASGLRGQQKMRVHYGVMQAVEMLMRERQGRRVGRGDEADTVSTWTAADIYPFVVAGLHTDSVMGARVQQAALGLAMKINSTLGKASLLPVLELLSPAAKDILNSRLEEEGENLEDMDEDDGDEDCIELSEGDGLCILGVGLRPQPDLSISKPNTTDGEECLMDEILEDTGLVFDTKGLSKKPPIRTSLDEELKGLGLDQDLKGLGLLVDDLDQLDTATSMPEDGGNGRRLRSKEGLLS